MRNVTCKKLLFNIIFLLIMFTSPVRAGSVEFTFDIPTIPATPKIVSTSNSTPLQGSTMKVYANIEGQIQRSVCCNGVCTYQCEPNCDFSACGITDFYGEADIRIVPNPTCIPNSVDSSNGESAAACQKSATTNPKLYYYFLDNPATMQNTGMTYDPATGNFIGDISLAAYNAGDSVAYFIIAADNRGNVISQVPSTTDIPCNSAAVSAWTSTLATPAIDNCNVMNSYEECGKYKVGKPSCGTTASTNDPTGDTCGSTSAIDTGGNNSKLDITGISAGIGVGFSELSGQKVVCSKINLSSNAPDIGDNSTPIGAYVMIFFNPDIVDPNPNDVYMTNATAITYAPGISGVDPNLVKVLWNGECVTNPNTADILSCKLITGGTNESRLKINSGDKSLLFIAQDLLPNGKNIVGTSSKSVTALIGSGSIQLDGGTPFWLVDMTAGFAVEQKNKTEIIVDIPKELAAPLVEKVQTCINGDGTSYPDGECKKASSKTTNTCSLTIKASPDAGIATEYRVYRATTDNVNTAISNGVIATISSNLEATNYYSDITSTLEGQINYYFFSSFKSGATNIETAPSKMSRSTCTVEDWAPPSPPENPSCSTPDGNSGKCYCTWTADTSTDPSLRFFKMVRDTTEISSTIPAASGISNYNITDDDSSLVLGQSYTYYVSAIDAGENESTAVSTTCVPEDLKAPEKVSDFSAFNNPGETTLDAKIVWNGVVDEDADHYNIYKCNNESAETSCTTFPHANWIKTNSSDISHTGSGVAHEVLIRDVPDITNQNFEGNYCFWVQACDNCVAAGTCESTEPNCSEFNTLPAYRSCIYIGPFVDPKAPATPQNLVAEALPEGNACKLTWSKVTTHSNGEPFVDPNNPTPMELDKYAIMSAPFGETLNDNPITSTPSGTAIKASNPSFTHDGLSNGVLYQYYVIAYDSDSKYSPPQGYIVTCTPEDTIAPETPANVMVNIGNSNSTCDLSWDAVPDDDVLSYTVHRCDDTASNCTAGDFPATWGENLGIPYADITDLELSDFDVDLTSNSYTYCVTTKDPSDNKSDLLDGETTASMASNCIVCSGGGEPPELPSNVSAAPFSSTDNQGVKITYTSSPSYAENGYTGGHNIYYCTDSACASKIKINTALETADHSTVSYDIEYLKLAAGNYYFGVSYQDVLGTESLIVVSGSVTMETSSSCEGTSCITITITGKFLEKMLVSCTIDDPECKTGVAKSVESQFAGAAVQVVNDSTGAVVKEISLLSNGSVPEIKVDPVTEASPGASYKVILYVPSAVYTGTYGTCENSTTAASEGCDVIISEPQTFVAGKIVTGAGKTISSVRGGGLIGNGAEIGNANGDEVINLSDLSAIKAAFGQSATDRCYRAWADFNMDGFVNLSDLSVMRKYFGKTIATADGETISPSIVKSNYPYKGTDDACCETKTCQ